MLRSFSGGHNLLCLLYCGLKIKCWKTGSRHPPLQAINVCKDEANIWLDERGFKNTWRRPVPSRFRIKGIISEVFIARLTILVPSRSNTASKLPSQIYTRLPHERRLHQRQPSTHHPSGSMAFYKPWPRLPANFPRIRFVNQKPIHNMQELICFIYLGYIFPAAHLEDLECICTCWFQPLYASVHTSICEAIKQALTTHVNCVPHNKLNAYLQKKKKRSTWLLSVLPCVSGVLITAVRDTYASSVFLSQCDLD